MSRQTTDRLVGELAVDVAAAGNAGSRLEPTANLAWACVGSFGVALSIALPAFGSGVDLARSVANPWLYWKLLCMGALARGAWMLVRDLARPSYAQPRIAVLVAAVVLLGLGAVADPSSLSIGGRIAASVPICLAGIVLQSLPGIVIIVATLRASTTSTRPMRTGAAAGLLAGTLGAAAYAVVCRNDGGLFVLVWYGTGVTINAVIGALLGRRLLAW